MNKLPHRQELLQPVLDAISRFGGSASIEEISVAVIDQLAINDEIASLPRPGKQGANDPRTALEYDLAWVRTYLKQLGYLENSRRGIWTLTNAAIKNPKLPALKSTNKSDSAIPATSDPDWYQTVTKILTESLTPSAFERLIQRVLRETGFVQVEVTGRTNDGGIDGRGIARINGILSFRVVFQCKRYRGSVGAPEIRDFRGAMMGRADKGLFITTGHFTREAQKEAIRDGAHAIDLVDGVKLAEKLKELSLGVKITTTESVSIDSDWFARL